MVESWPLDGREGLGDRLRRVFESGRLPHAWLLHGAFGVGKRRLALALAKGLLCREGPSFLGCGWCVPCGQAERGGHPDLLVLERPEGKARIPVALVRGLVGDLGKAAVSGRGRVALCAEAEALGVEGQNALLKTLEEPLPGAWLILTTTRPDALLPTVRSRVESYKVPPLPEDGLRAWIRARGLVSDSEVEDLVRLAGGSPGTALRIVEEGWLPRIRPLLAGRGGEESKGLEAIFEEGEGGKAGREEKRARAAFACDLCLAALRTRFPEAGALARAEALLRAKARLDLGLGAEIVLRSLEDDYIL